MGQGEESRNLMPVKRRTLSPREKAIVMERQGGRCACGCNEPLVIGQTDFDHDRSLWTGDDNDPEAYRVLNDLANFRALKRRHHLAKSGRETSMRAKADRQGAKHRGEYLKAHDRELAKIMARTKQIDRGQE